MVAIFILSFLNLFKLAILYFSTDLYHIYSYFFVKQVEYPDLNISVAVVIPAHNEEMVIYKTLQSVFHNKYQNFQVYIADDGSTDGTKIEIQRFQTNYPSAKVNYVYKKNSGKAEALNNVIRNYVTEEVVMCLDADCLLSPDALEKAAVYFNNPNVTSMISNVKILPRPSFLNFVQRLEYMMGFYLKKGLDTTNMEYIVGGAGSMFRKSVLAKINYYDSDTITEDIDLSMKIIQDGKQNWIVFGNDVLVWTQGPTNFTDLFKQRYRWKLGWMQTMFKNRNLLFNADKKFNWSFTLYYMPYMIFAQLMFLLDPIFVLIVAYYSIVNQDFMVLVIMIVFYLFLSCIAIMGDDNMTKSQKFFYLTISPMSYIAMTVISFIEYGASIKCIYNWSKILNYKKNKHVSWSHVQRIKH
jgi:poly-beta-1,6-N-acetyl-D-glucosamine synthase